MHASHRIRGSFRTELEVEKTEKFHAVRVPFLSRELMILAVVLLLGGGLAVLLTEPDASAKAGRERLLAHDKLLENVLYSADGNILISCAWDHKVRLWSVADNEPDWGSEIASLPHSSHVNTIAITPDARFLATAGTQGFVIWENRGAAGWECVADEQGFSHRSLAASPDGQFFAIGYSDGSIRFWDLQTHRSTTILRGFTDEVRSLAFSKDGGLLLASSFDGKVLIWRLEKGKTPAALPMEVGLAQSVAINPAGTVVATAHGEGVSSVVNLWSVATGQRLAQRTGGEFGNNVLVFSPDGGLLACGDKDNIIRLRDPETGEMVASLDQEMGWVKTLAFAPDGRRIAYGGQDGSIRFRRIPEAAHSAHHAKGNPGREI